MCKYFDLPYNSYSLLFTPLTKLSPSMKPRKLKSDQKNCVYFR